MKMYDPEIWKNENNGYEELIENIKKTFASKLKDNVKTPLFRTSVSDLFDTFLYYLPDACKQEYTCRACKHFVDRFGGLVFIKEDGTTESAIWNVENIPGMFIEPITQMKEIVESTQVQDIFVSDYVDLGTYDTNGFHHFSVKLPRVMINTSRVKNASQVSAEKAEDYGMLKRALEKYSMSQIDQALNLLESGSLYRGSSYVAMCKWFKETKEKIASINDQPQHTNMIWKYAATAPNGFTHISGSMLGTLLDYIVDGDDFDTIKRKFETNMSAENYRRSQSAPTQRAVESAEKLIEKLGLADSLRRRYAKLDELPENEFIWKSKTEKKDEVKTGVFSGVQTKAVDSNETKSVIPQVTMTWDKFRKTILPTADKLEVKVDGTTHLMGMVTAAVPESENIMNWDNPFSWYYQSGIDSIIRERLEEKGAKYEGCEIRCSLIWNTRTDLDVHCICPDGVEIYFGHKNHGYGSLDVDANVNGETVTPVENIRWSGKSKEPYSIRSKDLDELEEKLKFHPTDNIEVVPRVYHGYDHSKIWEWLQYAEDNDWEGCCINLDKPYECKRTKSLIKVKQFYDATLRVIGYEEGSGKNKGALGSLIVKYKDGKSGVGYGYSDQMRKDLWEKRDELIGKLIDIKYKEETKDKNTGLPSLQFAGFICFREDYDKVLADDEAGLI